MGWYIVEPRYCLGFEARLANTLDESISRLVLTRCGGGAGETAAGW